MTSLASCCFCIGWYIFIIENEGEYLSLGSEMLYDLRSSFGISLIYFLNALRGNFSNFSHLILPQIFIDLEKAFDTINHSILCVNFYGLRGNVTNMIQSYLVAIVNNLYALMEWIPAHWTLIVEFPRALPLAHYYFWFMLMTSDSALIRLKLVTLPMTLTFYMVAKNFEQTLFKCKKKKMK